MVVAVIVNCTSSAADARAGAPFSYLPPSPQRPWRQEHPRQDGRRSQKQLSQGDPATRGMGKKIAVVVGMVAASVGAFPFRPRRLKRKHLQLHPPQPSLFLLLNPRGKGSRVGVGGCRGQLDPYLPGAGNVTCMNSGTVTVPLS